MPSKDFTKKYHNVKNYFCYLKKLKSTPYYFGTVTGKFPVNSNGWHGEVDVQLSLFGLLLLTQPLNSSEQHTRADLEFSSDFENKGKKFCFDIGTKIMNFK